MNTVLGCDCQQAPADRISGGIAANSMQKIISAMIKCRGMSNRRFSFDIWEADRLKAARSCNKVIFQDLRNTEVGS